MMVYEGGRAAEWAAWIPCPFGRRRGEPRKVLEGLWCCEFCDPLAMKDLCIQYATALGGVGHNEKIQELENHIESWPIEACIAKECLASPGAQLLKFVPNGNARYACVNKVARSLWDRLRENCSD